MSSRAGMSRFFLFLGVLLAVLGGGGLARADEPVRQLRLLTYASERPSEELKKMEPIQRALELGLNRQAGPRYRVSMRIYPSYEEALRAVVNNEADVARLGPANYILAKRANPRLSLLATELHEGNRHFDGVFFVREDSGVRRMADLKGKRVAFGERLSTTGRYLPQAALVKAGITARDLAHHEFLGRHDKVVFAVASGEYAAGVANENTFEKYAQEKGLRELARFPSPTHAWVASPALPAELRRDVTDILVRIEEGALKGIDRSGLGQGLDSTYDELRRAMKLAEKFGS